MAPEVSAATGLRRLADQLQTLSELTESLTYRLLELEEKVAATDLRLEPLLTNRGVEASQLAEDTELRLDDTEERLARLEGVLAGLRAVPRGGEVRLPADRCAPDGSTFEADPHFPDEDFEQSFLDEQGPDEEPLCSDEPIAIAMGDDADGQQRLIA